MAAWARFGAFVGLFGGGGGFFIFKFERPGLFGQVKNI
jgi:hypothetical protein